MQGILLAGGSGTRLWPTTIATSKQLLPIYDKPLIYYPLSNLILTGCKKIVLVTNPEYIDSYEKLLGNGSRWGIEILYVVQREPKGIPEAITLAKEYLDLSKPCILILGDNLLYGPGLGQRLFAGVNNSHAKCFGYSVTDPSQFGVAILNDQNKLTDLIEKPRNFISRYAIPGCYIFPKSVYEYVSRLKPSDRGELEIIDLLRIYLQENKLDFQMISRGNVWLDTGSPEGLLAASEFVKVVQDRQGLLVGSPDETAWRIGNISSESVRKTANFLKGTKYGQSLFQLIDE